MKGTHPTVDVWVVRRSEAVMVLVTNHVLPRHPIKTEKVELQLSGLGPPGNIYVERIDRDHAHAKPLWVEMGRPAVPTAREVEQLHAASRLLREPQPAPASAADCTSRCGCRRNPSRRSRSSWRPGEPELNIFS